MLKIYLDWNIITHLKKEDEKNTLLRKMFAKYCKYFVFPFSKAHLHDLGFGNKACPGYEKDIHNLSVLCGTHLLEFDNVINGPYPYQCTPQEYIEKREDDIEFFLSGFSKSKFHDLLSRVDYVYPSLKDILYRYRIQPVKLPHLNKEVSNLGELTDLLLDDLSIMLRDTSVCGKIEAYIKDCNPEEYVKIKRSDFQTIFNLLDDICFEQVGKSVDDLLKMFCPQENSMNYFISLYLLLNLVGYHSDKKRSLLNIITDAIHAYYASRCDVFVTNDHALKEKVKAVYNKCGIHTKVVEKDEIAQVMEDEAIAEFDVPNFIKNILPTLEPQHLCEKEFFCFKKLSFRFLGLFNYCAVAIFDATNIMTVIFKLRLLPNDYIYYTELLNFFEFVDDQLNEEESVQFNREYVDVFKSGNKDEIMSSHFDIKRDMYYIRLMADSDSEVPLPMMAFSILVP